MRLATRANGTADGELMVVSPDGARWLSAGAGWPTLLQAIENWRQAEAELLGLAARVANGEGDAFDPAMAMAPLPRSWQWLDGSVFPQHGRLIEVAFGLDPVTVERPFVYQGLSDRFFGPHEDVPFTDLSLGIDFEGEFGIVVDAVPMGISAEDALDYVKLIVLINDWSLRALGPVEMKTGFGWVQAKPPCGMAPFAVTPEELRGAWRDGRVCLDLNVEVNGKPFGHANGEPMQFHFGEIIAHVARTRSLSAGTVIGSGTVSNANYAEVGSSCISERRAIEIIEGGAPVTPFLSFGDEVRMYARTSDGRDVFGELAERVVAG